MAIQKPKPLLSPEVPQIQLPVLSIEEPADRMTPTPVPVVLPLRTIKGGASYVTDISRPVLLMKAIGVLIPSKETRPYELSIGTMYDLSVPLERSVIKSLGVKSDYWLEALLKCLTPEVSLDTDYWIGIEGAQFELLQDLGILSDYEAYIDLEHLSQLLNLKTDYSLVKSELVFSDLFDSYNDGNLVGQGGWTLTHGVENAYQVQGVVYQGVSGKSAACAVLFAGVKVTVPAVTSGRFSGYIRVNNAAPTRKRIALRDGNTLGFYIYMYDGHFYYQNSTQGISLLPIDTTYNINQWYKLEIDFNTVTDKYVEIRIDGVVKGTNLAAYPTTKVDNIFLLADSNGSGTYYLDSFNLYQYI